METKVRNGTTFITQIHHRQTPMRIMEQSSDAGPVWQTEAMFQEAIGNPIEKLDIPGDHNVQSTTAAGILKTAPRKEAARKFLEFLASEQSASIYERYGFEPIRP